MLSRRSEDISTEQTGAPTTRCRRPCSFSARYNWHRLHREVRGKWAYRFPLNSAEGHIPDPLVPRSFLDRMPTPAVSGLPGGSLDSSDMGRRPFPRCR
jgi:hypothetical protein